MPRKVIRLVASESARRTLLTVADQACSSGGNFLLLVLIARSTGTTGFGQFAIGFGVLTWTWAINRAALGLPLGLDIRALDERSATEYVGRSYAAAAASGLLAAAILLCLAFILEGSFLRLAVFALAAPLLMVQDLARFVCFAQGRVGRALVSDGVWLFVGLAALLLDLLHVLDLSALASSIWWIAGCALALVVAGPVLAPPVLEGSWHWFRSDVRRRQLLADASLGAGVPLLIAAFVAAAASSATVGELRGASTLMSPINVLIAALGFGMVAEAARLPEPEARRMTAWVSLMLVIAVVLWTTILLLLPPPVGHAVLGATWEPARHILPLTALEYVGLGAWTGATTLLRATGRTRRALNFRVVYATLSLLAAAGATVIWQRSVFIAGALAIVALGIAAVAWQRSRINGPSRIATSSAPTGRP